MAADSAATDNRTQTAAERLEAIRGRVAELHSRIKTERDPKAAAELRAEVGKFTELIAELVQASGGKPGETKKAVPVVWPRDMNTKPRDAAGWGGDPAGVRDE